MMDQREERVFLDVVSDATKRATRKAEVYLPGDVYRAITLTAVLDQGDVQRLSHPTCTSAKNISKDPGMRETVRRFLLRELPTAGWYGLDGGDLLAEVSRKAKMLLDDMY